MAKLLEKVRALSDTMQKVVVFGFLGSTIALIVLLAQVLG